MREFRARDRIVIQALGPLVDGGRHPVKRVVGEPVEVGATVFADGADRIRVVVAHRPPGSRRWLQVPMVHVEPGLDRWRAVFVPEVEGSHPFRVLAWVDAVGSWADATVRKRDAGRDVGPDLLEGAALLERVRSAAPAADRAALAELAARVAAGELDGLAGPALGDGDGDGALELVHRAMRAADAATSRTVEVLVERERALASAWYELFPRSWGPEPGVAGTLRDVTAALDEIAGAGFDVLYLPPIHPIGTTHRKGPDNAETAGPGDPGSPWAIGGAGGGHTAVDPALGTLGDLRDLVRAAAARGIELALDVALQCSPDHPWVRDHPEWFRRRPDGSIHYAENPPKVYQDIHPLDFGTESWRELWDACLEVFLFWCSQGVRIFRVDNPHTKPFAFWEWLIAEVRRTHPEVVFLSEAFTRPAPMHRLGQIGFTQSYTYFPWRRSKQELTDYFAELSSAPSLDELRPNSWPTTPDILPYQLMGASPGLFASRALLAATLSASYGVYGPAFELGENTPAGNGKEEYASSEKYQLRWWERDRPESLRPLLTRLNAARRAQAALRTQRTLRFHGVDDEALLCYSKTAHGGPSTDPARPDEATVLVVANLDGDATRAGMTALDLGALGVDPARPFVVDDLLSGATFSWDGPRNYVELDPAVQPGHVLRVTQP